MPDKGWIAKDHGDQSSPNPFVAWKGRKANVQQNQRAEWMRVLLLLTLIFNSLSVQLNFREENTTRQIFTLSIKFGEFSLKIGEFSLKFGQYACAHFMLKAKGI